MITIKEFQDRQFKSKKELFKALKENKSELLALKKGAIKIADSIPMARSIEIPKEAIKSLQPLNSIGYGSYVYPVINTTKYMDSHDDVHLDGIWDKSVVDQTGKTFLIVNHELKVGNVISQPKDVIPFTRNISWKELGFDYEGETQALIFKSKLSEKSNQDGYMAYKDNDPVEHSIRMRYVKVDLAINDNDDDFKEEKALFDKYYPVIANKERVDEAGYFWAVSEAKIEKEGSMVLAGSNDATPTLYDLKHEPSNDTQKQEAAEAPLSIFNYL